MASHSHSHEPTEPDRGGEDLGVTGPHEKVHTVRIHRPAPEDTSFIAATFKGLGITLKHFFRNVVTKSDVETIRYPEEREPYPERNRGLHRLMKRDDGTVRCVACMMCPTVCPADCITIIPGDRGDDEVEKYPVQFEIDELRCVVCGLCVEACPCDAIRMDTGLHAPPVERRGEAIMTRDEMLELGIRSVAVQGGIGDDWRDEQEPHQYQPVPPESLAKPKKK